MNPWTQMKVGYIVSFWVMLSLFSCSSGIAQIQETKTGKVESNVEESVRIMPICETEQRLLEKYATYQVQKLVRELTREDSVFYCYGPRLNPRITSRRSVLRSLISQKVEEAFPHLIDLVEEDNAEMSSLALEIIQYADDKLLRKHPDIFIEKSASKNGAERNRSLFILQRIKNEEIEESIVQRWNEYSNREVQELSETSSLRGLFELMLYSVRNRTFVEESILKTLREKELNPTTLTEYLLVLSSFVSQEHSVEIDTEVLNILLQTKDPTVADYTAEVLSKAPSLEARNGLIRALDVKNEEKRAVIAKHLISRSDFELFEEKKLLERLLIDESPKVLNRVNTALIWKKPTADESYMIVMCLLRELNQSERATPQRVSIMMRFYANLSETMRELLKVEDASIVLKAIETALNSTETDQVLRASTERIFEQVTGEKEMDMTHLEFWKMQLELH